MRYIFGAGVGAGIVGSLILTPLLLIPVLGAIGFSAAGPVAGNSDFFFAMLPRRTHVICHPATLFRRLGTLAAGIQSGIGNVAAGSLFAGAQAAAMGAGFPVIFSVIGGAVTGVLGAAGAGIARAFGFWR